MHVLSKLSFNAWDWYAADCAVVRADFIVDFGLVSIAPKQNSVVSTDLLDVAFCAATLGDILSPDSCRFIMLGILNASHPSETVLVSGVASLSALSHVTPGLSAEPIFPSEVVSTTPLFGVMLTPSFELLLVGLTVATYIEKVSA